MLETSLHRYLEDKILTKIIKLEWGHKGGASSRVTYRMEKFGGKRVERILCGAGSRGGWHFFKARCWNCSKYRGMQQKNQRLGWRPGAQPLTFMTRKQRCTPWLWASCLQSWDNGFLMFELGGLWHFCYNSISKRNLMCCERRHRTLEIEDFQCFSFLCCVVLSSVMEHRLYVFFIYLVFWHLLKLFYKITSQRLEV